MERVIELLKNEAFVEELVKLDEEQDVINLFAKHGVTVTIDELNQLFDELPKNEELSEDDLQKVAGGGILGTVLTITPKVTKWLTATYPRPITYTKRW